jgi:hypothetical protein
MLNKKSILLAIASLLCLSAGPAALAAPWAEQGPGPILNGQDEGIPNNPVAGAINAIVPITADTVFVGTVNGGVWKTSNATAATPTWTPLTDTQLPALSINSLAVSPVNANTLFAGTGSTSSFGFLGSPGFGVARSIDGGTTWTVLNNPSNIFTGRRIDSVVPTTLGGGNVVLAATLFDGGGVYRSIDNGGTFIRISGNGTSGLPNAGVSQLIADPGNTSRFYAGVPQNFLVSGTAGVYRSDDGGVTWTLVNGSGGTALTGLANSLRILLSVNASNSVVYADIINIGGNLNGVFRSTNLGGAWTSLGTPAPSIYPGNQGNIHGALAADPANQNVVFIAGDRQANNGPPPTGFPNTNGCNNFSANVFRGDASLLPGNPWQNVVCNGANGTSPHADSRDMKFDANGNLLQANDGGIFRLVSPNSAGNRVWAAVVGNIRPNELHSAAFDPVSKVVFGGAQDTGTPIQSTPGSFTWNELDQGDGGVVAVDGQTALPNSLRYTTRPNFGCTRNPGDPSAQNVPVFFRTTWTAGNVRLDGFPLVGLNVVGPGQNLCQFDANIQFYNPYVLNVVDPTRMLIGTQNIYESLNQGDSLTNLGAAGGQVGDNFSYGQPIAYGGRLSGTNFPAVFYVGAGATIRHRVSGSIVTLAAYPGATVRTIVMNPQNYQQVFVSDSNNQVWGSFNEGASWIDLTANLSPAGSISPSLTSQVGTIEIFSPDQTLKNMVLIAGGFGAFQMRRPAGGGSIWTPLSTGIPNALVQDLHYDYGNNVLVTGTLGRGSWTLTNFFRGGGGTGAVAVASGSATGGSTGSLIPLLDLPPAPPIANMATPDTP